MNCVGLRQRPKESPPDAVTELRTSSRHVNSAKPSVGGTRSTKTTRTGGQQSDRARQSNTNEQTFVPIMSQTILKDDHRERWRTRCRSTHTRKMTGMVDRSEITPTFDSNADASSTLVHATFGMSTRSPTTIVPLHSQQRFDSWTTRRRLLELKRKNLKHGTVKSEPHRWIQPPTHQPDASDIGTTLQN